MSDNSTGYGKCTVNACGGGGGGGGLTLFKLLSS